MSCLWGNWSALQVLLAGYPKLLEDADSGRRARFGGLQSVANRRSEVNPVHEEILRVARDLLNSGKSERDLPWILRQRMGGIEGYPTSERQYRRIIRKLH